MAVIAMWKCDRDNSMFENRKEADAHDRMLELGEQYTQSVWTGMLEVGGVSAWGVGLVLAGQKEWIMQACEGRPVVMSYVYLLDKQVTQLTASR
mgnify:CR=1 FL=1